MAGAKDSNSSSSTQKSKGSFTIRLRDFGDENIHKPGGAKALIDYDLDGESIIDFFIMALFGNGNCDDNKGYVSMVFRCMAPLIFGRQPSFNFSCIVAVKDISGNKRFVRSFTFPFDPAMQPPSDNVTAIFTIDRYVERRTLLDDRHELLPDDILTLEIDVDIQKVASDESSKLEDAINSSFKVEESSGGNKIVLSLDSDVGSYLYEVSSMFRALCDTQMMESSKRYVCLPGDDDGALRNACRIIMGAKAITFGSFDDIMKLYVFADKYDIQKVLRCCRGFLKDVLYLERYWGTFEEVDERFSKILQLLEWIDDPILRVIVDGFLESPPTTADVNKERSRAMNLGGLICEYQNSPLLYFELNKDDEDVEASSTFEFYQ